MRARGSPAWAVLAALALGAPPLAAHLRFPELPAERSVELRIDGDAARVVYRIAFAARLAAAERRLADRDGDGEVSAAEGNAALDARTAALLPALRLCAGRTRGDVSCRAAEARDVERAEGEGWQARGVDHLQLQWTLRFRERPADVGALRFEDDDATPGAAITEVEIEGDPGRPLLVAGDGQRESGVSRGFTWVESNRGPGPRVVHASWSPPARLPRWAFLVVAVTAAAGAVAAASRRSHRAVACSPSVSRVTSGSECAGAPSRESSPPREP